MGKNKRTRKGFLASKSVHLSAQRLASISANQTAAEQKALALVNQGYLKEAEAIYRELISSGQQNHIILSNLAAICGMQGRTDELFNFLSQALELKPDFSDGHNNLGNLYREQGDIIAAIASYNTAIELQPGFADAHYNLGIAYQSFGDMPAAIASYKTAVQLNPDNPDTYNNLGIVLKEQGDLLEAIICFNKTLELKHNHPEVHNNLGSAHKEQGDLTAAIASFKSALLFNPSFADAHYNLGIALKDQGDLEAAIASFQTAIHCKPNYPNAYNNLGIIFNEQGNPAAAIDAYNTALKLQPDFLEVHYNLGIALNEQGELSAAHASYNSALSFKPNFPDAHTSLSMLDLLTGDYTSGLERYDYRFEATSGIDILIAKPNCPKWNGSALQRLNTTLLLVGEQGLGDTLQFMRYAHALRKQGITVTLCAQPNLHGLIQVSGIDDSPLTPEQANQVNYGQWLPLLSVPRHLQVSPANPIITEPYIKTTNELNSKWADLLKEEQRPIIGINWQGNPAHEKTSSTGRSFPLEAFGPIANIPNLSLLSLQKGFGSEQLHTCSFHHRFVACQDQINDTWDYLESAAIIANCDLIITSDTSVAHLAGGMGKPTWLLLKKVPEWRWGLEGDTTFWYPSMRLFRQRERANWDEVINRVSVELNSYFRSEPLPPFRHQDAPISEDQSTKKYQALSLYNQGNLEEAEAIYRGLIAAGTHDHIIYSNLAALCGMQGNIDEAIQLLKASLSIQPNNPDAHNNIGNVYQEYGNLEAAIASFKKAIQLKPNYPEAYTNLGNALMTLGDLCSSISAYSKALDIQPDYLEALINLAMAELLIGDYRNGWERYEYRFQSKSDKGILNATPKCPQWNGNSFSQVDKLLLVSEQGLGDTLQFMRYAIVLRNQGFSVSLCAHPKLHTLIQVSGIDPSPLTPDQANQFTEGQWIPLLSVPRHLGVTPETPILTEPYIKTTNELIAKWRDNLSAERRPIIGINWQGNPSHEKTTSVGRSLPLESFAPIAESLDATFLSLQKGYGSEQLATCSFNNRFVACQDDITETWDFLETAAVIANCDLVISSDTSLAHLSAGMGKTTWLLLKKVPEWRWGLADDSTFWYPSMRLFRQSERGNWDELMERVAVELKALFAGILLSKTPKIDISSDQAARERQALALLNQGNLLEAEEIYRELSKIDPLNFKAFGNLGALCLSQNRPVEAVAYLDMALNLNPGYSFAHNIMGNALKKQGDLIAAIASYNAALELNPNFPDVYFNLGNTLAQHGDLDAAIQAYNSALKLKPNFPDALNNLGNALKQQGELSLAIAAYSTALNLKPNFPDAHYNLGVALNEQGDLPAAISSYNSALKLKPNYSDAYNNLGIALSMNGDLLAAIASYKKSLSVNPNHPDSHYNLGVSLHDMGDLSAAIASYNKALELNPKHPEAHKSLAMTELLIGDYKSGLARYDYRFHNLDDKGILNANPICPQWDGSTLTHDDKLLIVSEQGLGDTFQFMRYVITLRNQGISVSLCTYPKLHKLIQVSGIDPFPLSPDQANQVTEGQWIPLLSVPKYLGVTPKYPISTDPYIKTTPELIEKWKNTLSTERQPVIGINWQGNPAHEKTTSVGRSLPLETFAPIAARVNASFLSLQKGFGSEQLLSCSFWDRFVSCQDQVNETWDFLETAAIIANCELVITSDTSVAHLAAGMGKTTWLLLKKVPEWRWGLEGDSTFWYPSMRLFRQNERGNWDDLMEQVAVELLEHLRSTSTASSNHLNPHTTEQDIAVECQAPRLIAHNSVKVVATTDRESEAFNHCDDISHLLTERTHIPKRTRLRLSDIKMLCISLTSANARRQSILDMKLRFGFDLDFIDAIDGRGLTKDAIQAATHRKIRWHSLNGHRDEISKSTQVACCLSHIKAWEWIVDEGIDQAIILEDDICCSADIELELPCDAEFTYLSTRANRNLEGEVAAPVCGSEAYHLTIECAKKLLLINQEIRMPIDIQWLPQVKSLIASNHFLSEFTSFKLPFFKAYAIPGIFQLNQHHYDSQICSGDHSSNIDDLSHESNYIAILEALALKLSSEAKNEEAIATYLQIIETKRANHVHFANVAALYNLAGKYDLAKAYLELSIDLNHFYPNAHSLLGNALNSLGDSHAAVKAHLQSILLDPTNPGAHYNLAISLKSIGELDKAILSYKEAIALDPGLLPAYHNLGNTLRESGNAAEAIECLTKSISIDPTEYDQRVDRSYAYLIMGDYEQGWSDYEYRFQRKSPSLPHAIPICEPWNSQNPTPSNKLLVVTEQGLGDTLQFMRYLLVLRNQGFEVSICAQTKLHGLIKQSDIVSLPLTPEQGRQVDEGQWIPLLSTPNLLKVSPENPIITQPYIKTTDDFIDKWASILSSENLPVVAINWQGNPDHEKTDSSGRSLPLEAFYPIVAKSQVKFLSLQKGFGSEQLATCSFKDSFVSCQDLINQTWDFLETAAIIANCDLVITSDSAMAHLAAGMGKTTWLLLKKVPEWRWGLTGDTTFWYPSMRLFRQRERGNWNELMERVADELKIHFASVHLPLIKQTITPVFLDDAAKERQALALINQGNLHEAEVLYKELTACGIHNHIAHSNLAAIYVMQNRLVEAVASLEIALRLNPSYAYAYNILGNTRAKQGDLSAAIAAYNAALELRPNFPDALFNLGNAYMKQGDSPSAIVAYNSALKLKPNSPDVFNNLGNAFKDQANMADAIVSYMHALQLKPNFPDFHYNLAVALNEQGDLSAAIDSFNTAIELRPNYPEAYNNLGIALRERGDLTLAIASYNAALSLNPTFADVHNNLGIVLSEQGDLAGAISSYNTALDLRLNFPDAHNNLGIALKDQGDLAAAISSYKTALELKPNFPDALNNLGIALNEQGDPTAAIASYYKALELKPSFPAAHHNLGISLKETGDIDGAIVAYKQALELQPEYPEAQKSLAMTQLLIGDYSSGWENYEYRLETQSDRGILNANPGCHRWCGNPLSQSDKLLLVGEQGLGDSLQFMRYVIALRNHGISVSLCADPKLHTLIKTSGLDASPLTTDQANQVTEGQWIPLLSVPRYLAVTSNSPIITEPYIHTSDELIAKWRASLSAEQKPIIGINWQGNPSHEKTTSIGRSLPLEAFAPIAALVSASFLSLQKGFGSEQLATCSFKNRFVSCQQQINDTWDFLETAAIIVNCDLVITSDTSVAHLAAGLGKTTWLLLKKVPEWRWGLSGDSTFWYPSMRLFRQKERGNWAEVMEQVAIELQKYIAASRRVV